MMTTARRLLPLSIVFLAPAILIGCVQPGPVINGGCVGCTVNTAGAPLANATPSPYDLGFYIPAKAGEQNRYLWGQRSYTGSAAFLRVVQAEMDSALAKVQPATGEPLGSLRVIFPVWTPKRQESPNNTAGAEEAMRTEVEYWRIVDGARQKAIEKRNAFSKVTYEKKNISIPEPGQSDFTAWFDASIWQVRYKENSPSISASTADINNWVMSLEARAKESKNKNDDNLSLTVVKRGSQSHLQYMGKDYFTVDALRAVMEKEVLALGRSTPVVAERLGGRVKVILTDFTLMQKNGETSPLVLEGWQLHGTVLSKGRIEGLIASKLFDKVDVEVNNLSDAPLNGYDVVLWQPALDPWKWRYRLASSNDAFLYTPPRASYTSFASAFGDEIRRNKR